jgi:hypothetical protein
LCLCHNFNVLKDNDRFNVSTKSSTMLSSYITDTDSIAKKDPNALNADVSNVIELTDFVETISNSLNDSP